MTDIDKSLQELLWQIRCISASPTVQITLTVPPGVYDYLSRQASMSSNKVEQDHQRKFKTALMVVGLGGTINIEKQICK